MNITDHGLHIVPGDSAGGTWLATFDAVERLLVHQDDLSSGPLIQTPDLDSWKATRAAFWSEIHTQWNDFEDDEDGEKRKLGERLTNLERLKAAEAIYIWTGTGVGNQLFLMFVANLLPQFGIDRDVMRIVQFEPPSGWRVPCCSMSVLAPKELRAMPTPVHPTPDRLADYEAAWSAVTAGSPKEIMDYLELHPNGCPHVRHALERHLLRYPQEHSGLPLFDEWLLRNVEKSGPSTTWVLGETLCDVWEVGDGIGDNTLYHRLLRMASVELPEPLVEICGPTRLYRDTQVTLTSFGKAVINGNASSWPTNPIDDWIGGVRISADAPPQWVVTGAGELRPLGDSDSGT